MAKFGDENIKPIKGTMRGWNLAGELIFEQKDFTASKDVAPRTCVCTALYDSKTGELLERRKWDPLETGFWLRLDT